MNKDKLFILDKVSFVYQLGEHHIHALKEISLQVLAGSLTTFSGPSGSGKSTLLNILGLIEPVQKGTLIFQNEDISAIPEARKNEIRKFKIGFIFQHFHLIPVLTAEENVAYFLERQKLPKSQIKERTQETLEAVNLWEHRMKKPAELSGGQRQRVAIARAVAKHPEVIIGDEPTASLDQANGREIMNIFERLCHKKNISILLTTHDAMVQSYAEHNFHLQDGQLIN